jgi:hypothetical protein
MKKGGMSAQFFAVYVAASYVERNHAANRTLQMIDTVRHDIIEKYPNDFLFATTRGFQSAPHERTIKVWLEVGKVSRSRRRSTRPNPFEAPIWKTYPLPKR